MARKKQIQRKTVYTLFFLACCLILASGGFLRFLVESLPPIQNLDSYIPHLTTRIYDTNGQIISELFTERRSWIPLNEIPQDLQNAFIAIEDDRFFFHWGISPRGMFRAAIKNFLSGRVVQGGSTITQQLSKLIFLTQERTLARKLRELLLSLQIERRFSKDEILQMYLNQVYFGHGAYGVAAAAKIFFGKQVQDLTLSECALLAGIPRNPLYYSPFNQPKRVLSRRNVVLFRMQELKFISGEEFALASKSPMTSRKSPLPSTTAPYFVEYLRQTLEPKYGSDLLYRGGLSIYTTLDIELQAKAEQQLNTALENFDKEYGPQAEVLRAKEKQKEQGEKYKIQISTTVTKVQGALLALDPHTGGIRAMVGGRNYSESQFNRAVQAKRQPGSTFKPFVWLTALDNGYTATSIVEDLPILFKNDGQDWRLVESATDTYTIRQATADVPADKVWAPKNYDGKYFGSLTLRRAFAFSRNLVSVRLIYRLGAQKVAEWAHKLGIKSPLDPVLSLSLGTSVTTLLEMVNAFSTFAAEGVHTEPFAIIKVVDFDGKILEETVPQGTEVIDPRLNYLLVRLMRSVILEGTGRAARFLDLPVAGKTGTSQDQRDLWFVGYTPELVCGAWMGYDDFAPLGKKLASGGIVVPWWAEFMQAAHQNLNVKDFSVPEGILFAKIDPLTGYLSTPSCPKVILEAFIGGTEPKEFCPIDHTAQKLIEMETEE